MIDIEDSLIKVIDEYKPDPMPGLTHGQMATPQTIGKRFAVYLDRVSKMRDELSDLKVHGKLAGALGTWAAHRVSYPEIDWMDFSWNFVQYLGEENGVVLEPKMINTQIDSHDELAKIFAGIRSVNNPLINLAWDSWEYISRFLYILKKKEGEVGSSTMPHKVNPIDWENAAGNLEIANGLFMFLEDYLTKSRFDRDLSDSTVERAMGCAFAHSIIGYTSVVKALGKMQPNVQLMEKTLKEHPEIITEGIQTILRKEGVSGAYDKLKDLSRGKKLSPEDVEQFVMDLEIEQKAKTSLLKLQPENYLGYSDEISELALKNAGERRKRQV